MSFLASAWIALLMTVVSYAAGRVPTQLLTNYDLIFMRVRPRSSSAWSRAFRKAVLVFSDQQIVTGIAVLIAGFANLNRGISIYHWHIITYLAWMSSNVHLTSLTFLRDYLYANKSIRLWRISGMTVLFLLLFTALMPSARDVYATALWRDLRIDILMLEGQRVIKEPVKKCWSLQLPARCFWQQDAGVLEKFAYFRGSVAVNSILSYLFLVCSYVWKGATLFRPTNRFGSKWIYEKPLHRLRSWLKRAAPKQSASSSLQQARASVRYRLLMSVYVFLFAILEFITSFAGSLWITAIGLIWGTVAILSSRQLLPRGVRESENRWTFGQILPMLLLALPLLMMWEYFRSMSSALLRLDLY